MSAARRQNKIRLDFVIFRLNLLACCIKNAFHFLVSFFFDVKCFAVHPTCHKFMKNNSKLSHTAAIQHKKTCDLLLSTDVCECDFQGGWPPSLPICQSVSEVRGEFLLCFGVISISFV